MSKKITTHDVYEKIWDLMEELNGENSYFCNEISDNPNGSHALHVKFSNGEAFKISISKE